MTNRAALAAHLDAFAGTRVLCVGDVMLDRYVYGAVDRISPEAPIPVLHVAREVSMLGGAGNVARNLAGLGADVDFVAVVGDDSTARSVRALVKENERIRDRLVAAPGRRTGIKSRFVAGGQQLLRADDETVARIGRDTEKAVLDIAGRALKKAGALVLSDYAKGVLTPTLIAGLIDLAHKNGRPVIVDPKGRDFGRYTRADLLTPNRAELAAATGMDVEGEDALAAAAHELRMKTAVGAVLVTRGAAGMTLFGDAGTRHFAAEAQEVFDVSGAGDTVIAVCAAGLAAGLPLDEVVALANLGAGIVVGKLGTAAIDAAELRHALHAQDLLAAEAKVAEGDELPARIAEWRAAGLKIGFTNGCFDLLHPGHVSLIAQARTACDRLVVGLNSDASVRRLKGEGRPIQGESARIAVLASLAHVDLISVFDDDTPIKLIETVRPDVLVKGADYARADVVGGDFVESYGGRVVLADLVPGHSTTATISKLAK